MQQLPLEDDFRRFAQAPGSVVEAALLVTRVVEPACDLADVRARLARLAASAEETTADTLPQFLQSLGFAGAKDYYLPENSSLAHVLRTGRGIPITLAALLIGVADAQGIRAQGINFPGHFLVDLDGRTVDPFTMQRVDEQTRSAWLERLQVDAEQALRVASATDILLRMLNNLRGLAARRGDVAAELDLSGYQLIVAPEPLPIHVERAELWLNAGVPAMARRELDQALVLAPAGAMREALLHRRAAIEDAPPAVH